ncbi:MAG: WD40 repeat domain-containing protein [Gemmataceae bacterium]|nr:WD40 repeat domain-containing protein [Gemmataceae bacterium]MDW8266652.1 WD40 repeat domain-containing protein [Gemmataceae bacterium]
MPEPAALGQAKLLWTLPFDADWVTAVCFLGSTRRLAAGNNLGQVLIWDLPEQPDAPPPLPRRRLDGHTNAISRLVATADGRWLISASYDHTIRYWDTQASPQGQETLTLNARAREEAGRRGGKVPPAVEATVNVQPATQVLRGHRDWVSDLALSRDEQLLLSGGDDGWVVLWDRPAAKEQRRWQLPAWAYAVALSPDNRQALVSERRPLVFDSSRHAGVRLWDVTSGTVQRDLSSDFKGIYISAADYSPDGKLLALGRGGEVDGFNGKVFLLDPASPGKPRELSPGHQYGITDLAFHPDGRHLASSGRDTVVRLWDTAAAKVVQEIGKPRGSQFKDWIHAIAFSADGRWLATADMAGAVQVWAFSA